MPVSQEEPKELVEKHDQTSIQETETSEEDMKTFADLVSGKSVL
jgi:hypothetical protein